MGKPSTPWSVRRPILDLATIKTFLWGRQQFYWGKSYRPESVNQFKRELQHRLDAWLGEERRRRLLMLLCPNSDGDSANMTPAQVLAMLFWMGIDYDPVARVFSESDNSLFAHQEADFLIAEHSLRMTAGGKSNAKPVEG